MLNKLQIFNYQGINVTDSRQVAEKIGKEHKNLLRDIQGYAKVIEDSSKLSRQNFFIESTYQNSQNKTQPCYLLTKQGCEMVANKMTGEKGILFTAEYVQAFNKMEQHIPRINMSKELQAIFMIDGKAEELKIQLGEVKDEVADLKNNLPLLGVDCEELTKKVQSVATKFLGYKTPAYNNKSMSRRLYSDIYGQLRREFGVRSYKAIKRSKLSQAINIIESYSVPIVLQDEITMLNNQVSF
ncbi:Rha family transcriptional regulator [Clostridium butyricum]|jgi:Rha family phage regulatory protein|uniref:Rha family transcriptional regulator n=1 Tax=Clostridium butyricum TaxID=1492 RepID=UPI0004016D7C|nr:Rha family transcriptional regulator [Clostridium butyricum]MCQ2017252.1 ORF6C domain-containing protein [Clostridium butyricum]MCQ2021125.1 ORF6C domain-containing protein [Clostridium butyricum]